MVLIDKLYKKYCLKCGKPFYAQFWVLGCPECWEKTNYKIIYGKNGEMMRQKIKELNKNEC